MRDILGHDKGRTLFGQPVQQSWGSLFVIEQMLVTYRPDCIIELGTGNGNLTQYFCIYAEGTQKRVYSVDMADPLPLGEWRCLDYCFNTDLRNVVPEWMEIANRAETPYVLCDAWDPKSDQVNLIAPLLKHGALISAHDYWTPKYNTKKPKWCFEDKDINWDLVRPQTELCEMDIRYNGRMLWLEVK